MEEQIKTKTEIYKILNEIVGLNESILSLIYNGYNEETVQNLKRYKSIMKDFAADKLQEKTASILMN